MIDQRSNMANRECFEGSSVCYVVFRYGKRGRTPRPWQGRGRNAASRLGVGLKRKDLGKDGVIFFQTCNKLIVLTGRFRKNDIEYL